MSGRETGMRLNRFLARAGFGSRRAVEDLIRAGRVHLGGEVVTDLGRRVETTTDVVTVDGTTAHLPDTNRIYAFHKPLGVVSTLRAQGGQPSLLPYRRQADLPDRFVPVGRLDGGTTGLLLWTDDGDLNQRLCRPASGVWKTYEIELDKQLPPSLVPQLTMGRIVLDDRACRPCRLAHQAGRSPRHWTMELHEGRKRQIRRMFAAVDLKVIRLHRTAVGPVRLGLLHEGNFRRLTAAEETALRAELAGA